MRTAQDWEERTNKQTNKVKETQSFFTTIGVVEAKSQWEIHHLRLLQRHTNQKHTHNLRLQIPRATETQTLNHLSSQDGELKLTSDGPRVELLIYWAIPPQMHPRPTGFGFTNLVQTSEGLSLLLQNRNSANSSRHSIPLATVLGPGLVILGKGGNPMCRSSQSLRVVANNKQSR